MPVSPNMNTTGKGKELTPQEKIFTNLVLKGMKYGPAAVKAGFPRTEVRKLLHREPVIEEMLGHFSRLGIGWQQLSTAMKECLMDVIALRKGTAGEKASPAIRVQACKVVALVLKDIDPSLLRDVEEEMTKDEATADILGKIVIPAETVPS